jgi:hypothetical protein
MCHQMPQRQQRGIERMPIAIDDACPPVVKHEGGEVHVGYGIAINVIRAEACDEPSDWDQQRQIDEQCLTEQVVPSVVVGSQRHQLRLPYAREFTLLLICA